MKIIFFHLKAHAIFDSRSQAPIGGTLVQMRIVAQKLSENPQNQVSFLVGDFGQASEEKYGSIIVYRSVNLKRSFLNILKAPILLWRDFNKINAEVYITSSASPEVGLLVLFGLIHKKKVIYRVAHKWDCSGEYVSKNGFFGKIFEWGLRHAYAVVVQTQEQAVLLKERYNLDGIIISNSYSVTKAFTNKNEEILWVSRCEKWKNPESFLMLAESLPQFKFIMICPKQRYQEEYHEKIKNQAYQLKNLCFIDFVPFDQIQEYFNVAKVFVGTSEYEGFPNTYLQACIGRTPIVSLKVDPDCFIHENNLGYIAQGDQALLSKFVSRLLQDKSDWTKKSVNAFDYVSKKHDIERNISQWEELLSN